MTSSDVSRAPLDGETLLVVDDDDTFRNRLVASFVRRNFQVFGAANPDEAMAVARRESPDLALLDLRMPGGTGLELLASLKAWDETIQVVVLTGYGSIATATEAIRLGATDYVPKPATPDEILAAFARDGSRMPPEESLAAPSLARAEWEHINRVLADAGGNISEASRRLGIHRRSLQRKLQKYPPRR